MTQKQKEKAQTIADHLSEEALLLQTVEELNELSQVLAKRARILRGENYTPCSDVENFEHLTEEAADVVLCLNVLNCKINIMREKYNDITEFKLNRWVDCLKNSLVIK